MDIKLSFSLFLVVVGVGYGAEQKVPVFTEQPGWGHPNSKFFRDVWSQHPRFYSSFIFL